ncbi:hypothetical protein [Clostridium sp. BNL1100]|uniref:hypothetical protein n=1 Tax=Clostridium sp. BNL1100 TaxID=755731 RepID=UPI00024A7566|nr:hypothetical protein [Clostridium sp. BNL1100]AEY67767.1 hypothetical protein Clo1100_3643 [Clostridium sp. BNL1100]
MEDPCSPIFIHFTAVIIMDPRLDSTETWVSADSGHSVDMETCAVEITMVPLSVIMGISALAEIMTTALAMATITKDITIMVTITTVIEPDLVKNNNLTGHRQVVVFNFN